MSIAQNQIDDLVARPSEGLPVEIKTWIDPASPEGLAKIVRACFAMRNQNGGFVVIGFSNKTLQVDTNGIPDDVRAVFHLDKIQQIVAGHAYEPFEIEVRYSKRNDIEIPVIVIPAGFQYPVASKADVFSADKKRKLVSLGDVFCRTLHANGSVSTAVAGPRDWRDIFERCFDNREADIGRFLRRHVGTAVDGLSFGGPLRLSLKEQMTAFLDDGLKKMEEAAADQNLPEAQLKLVRGGKFEAGLVLSPLKSDELSTQRFLTTLSMNNPRLTGWPIWIDSASFRDESARPIVKNGNWQALIISQTWGLSLDFNWYDPNGRFYLARNLDDDWNDRVKPGTTLEAINIVLRVAETIAVGLAYARGLGWAEDSTLRFAFRWSKLAGRCLSAWAHPRVYFSTNHPTGRDAHTTIVDVPIDTAFASIVPAVEVAVRPLFAEFGGFEFPKQSIENWVQMLLKRQT